MCICEYTDAVTYCDDCKTDMGIIVVGSEVFVDHPKDGTPVWAQVEEIDEVTGEVYCIGDDGEAYYANTVDDLELYPS